LRGSGAARTVRGTTRSVHRRDGLLTVLSGVLLAFVLLNDDDDVSTATRPGSRAGASATPGATTTSQSRTPSATPSPTATPSPGATPSPSATSPAATPSPTDAASRLRETQVVVLNETAVRGLGSTAAELLRAKGWDVPLIGNFRGTVATTTVYYPPGGRAAAAAVAADLPGPDRIRERFANLSRTRLTVILAPDFPSYVGGGEGN
jgi:hypothetical protein